MGWGAFWRFTINKLTIDVFIWNTSVSPQLISQNSDQSLFRNCYKSTHFLPKSLRISSTLVRNFSKTNQNWADKNYPEKKFPDIRPFPDSNQTQATFTTNKIFITVCRAISWWGFASNWCLSWLIIHGFINEIKNEAVSLRPGVWPDFLTNKLLWRFSWHPSFRLNGDTHSKINKLKVRKANTNP